MTESKICTCPSGDGSLVHPCPAHPAVEQVGGDERAAFELFVRKHCGMPAHIAVNWDAKFTNDAWEGWKARAALAQPSPPPHPASELDFSRPLETENGDPVKWICADVIEYKSARVCVAKDTGLVYSSPYIGLKIRNVMPEQAEAERPEGPTEDELEAAGLGYPLHKEEAVKLWYSGFRSEVITVLEAWEAIGHDIGMNPDKGELLDSLRYMLEKCEAHDAALAEVAGLRSLLNSLLCYVERDIDRMRSDRDKSDNKEIYDRSISLAMERLKAAQNAVFTTEPGCDTAVELAAQTTQAQHCVPVAREQLERLVRILDAHNYAKDAEALMALLAAAPAQAQHSVPELLVRAEDFVSGKEVPQAWLDVQAERRRQITAEGWTPEHDDEHSHGQMARAAACYALAGSSAPNDGTAALLVSLAWPWDEQWWKPSTARRDMVKACALALAEIERLDRAAASQGGPSDA
ncbi:hypothetical protein B5L72_09745 [Pseudomonas aeruginosa]|uniref:hypothetical protein n=2 Tax=Pseudomonas aeruginosa TaxID=287 RepID=UPI0009A7F572|nr:hypothetical protein [Pseudomonas aeruginosa]OPL30737.1 hypothetical protein B5L72_09745 [Pseudomonas aeruginosa]